MSLLTRARKRRLGFFLTAGRSEPSELSELSEPTEGAGEPERQLRSRCRARSSDDVGDGVTPPRREPRCTGGL